MEARFSAAAIVLSSCGLVAAQGGMPTFTTSEFPVTDGPAGVAIGDMDGDAVPDLVVTNNLSSDVALLHGDGLGGFGPAVHHAVPVTPGDPVLADMTGDGALDLLVGMGGSDDVGLLLGDGAGALTWLAGIPMGLGAGSIEVADFDLDGNLDLATGNHYGRSVSVRLGLGTGLFGSEHVYVVSTWTSWGEVWDIEPADVDGSGQRDIGIGLREYVVKFLVNQGGGAFALGTASPVSAGGFAQKLAFGDVDGDGDVDYQIQNEDITFFSGTFYETRLGLGDGTFCCGGWWPPPMSSGAHELVDVNLDGWLDHVSRVAMAVQFRLGDGTGAFSTSAPSVSVDPISSWIASSDVDLDGYPDLAVTSYTADTVTVLVNQLCPVASIESVQPGEVAALGPAPIEVLLTGCYVHLATAVFVDGAPLAAGAFGTPGPGKLELLMPLVDQLGSVDVRVVTPHGTATAQVTVVPPAPPLIVLATDGPHHLLHVAAGADVKSGASPGDLVFLLASTIPSPSVLPGIVSADIGGGFAELLLLSTSVVPAKAWLQQVFPLAGVPLGTTIYLQGGVLSAPGYALPLATTPVVLGTVAL